MLIVCPSCASEYDIDPARLGPGGRKVRCAACQSNWFAAAAPVALVAPPDGSGPVVEGRAVAVEGARRREAARGKPRGPRSATVRGAKPPALGRRLALGAAAACLLAVPAAILARTAVVAAAPRSASLFAAIGLPVNLVGLRLAEVSSSLGEEAGKRVLVVEGEITGLRDGATPIPELELTIEGESGETLYQWTAKAPAGELGRGDTTRFRARLASPPPAARNVLVTFADRSGRAALASR